MILRVSNWYYIGTKVAIVQNKMYFEEFFLKKIDSNIKQQS
jgi:hypothetical protein